MANIKIGIIGTSPMISNAEHWLNTCMRRIENDGTQPFLYPHFPGINEDFPFCCELMFGETWRETILDKEVKAVLEPPNFLARIGNVVELYKIKIETISQRDPQPDVIMCCIPQEIIDHCTTYLNKGKEEKRIKISKSEKTALKFAKAGQQFLWSCMDPTIGIEDEEYGSQNLRRGIKAQAMQFGIPTQIIWPRTFQKVTGISRGKKERPLQDMATRSWNFFTALYHKAGATPWRLSGIDPTVCFLGISFYSEIRSKNPELRTSLAQTFTAAGDGYVMRGRTFEWDKSGRSPHLDEDSASALIGAVLDLYKRHNMGSLPSRLVIHKSSKYWEEEISGFQEASKLIPRKDFISFGKRGIQFYRFGDYPPLRGTFIKFSDTNFLLYSSGYIPFLRSYPGPRAPMPLEILEHFGDSPWDTVLREILALTKMNWNTADYACGRPITTAFAQRVGLIMAEIPEDIKPRGEYRFYM